MIAPIQHDRLAPYREQMALSLGKKALREALTDPCGCGGTDGQGHEPWCPEGGGLTCLQCGGYTAPSSLCEECGKDPRQQPAPECVFCGEPAEDDDCPEPTCEGCRDWWTPRELLEASL